MKRSSTEISRRALLGAACAVHALTRHPGLDPGSTFFAAEVKGRWTPDQVRHDERWQNALAAFRRAETAVAALEGTPDDDAFNRAAEAQDRALERLLRAPAPDIAALAEKLRLARRHQAWELRSGDASMAALEQDALRLS